MSSWYKVGKEGIAGSKKKDAEQQARQENRGPMRFWLKNGGEAKGVFLDTPNFFFDEHNIKLNGNWYNYFTCRADFDMCPFDNANLKPSHVVAGTFIDFSSYERKDGTKVRVAKKLFVAPGTARQNLVRQIERRGGDLSYCYYTVARGMKKTECATGEDFEFIKKINKASLVKAIKTKLDEQGTKYTDADIKEFITPFDYSKIFYPKSIEELRKVIGGSVPVGAAEDDPLGETDATESAEEEIEDLDELIEQI